LHFFAYLLELPLLLADLGFVDRLIQMFDRFDTMAVEIMLRGLQMVFGAPHRFQRFVDVRVLFGRGCSRRCRRNRSRCWNRRRRRFRPRCRRREGQRKEKCCQDEQSQQPDLFQVFLLVRIPARTQPV
jgi:hypothetical protein